MEHQMRSLLKPSSIIEENSMFIDRNNADIATATLVSILASTLP
jgi:hypothetical protein